MAANKLHLDVPLSLNKLLSEEGCYYYAYMNVKALDSTYILYSQLVT
jgi:hypothetical protein